MRKTAIGSVKRNKQLLGLNYLILIAAALSMIIAALFVQLRNDTLFAQQGACTDLPTALGIGTETLQLSTPGDYRVWSRVKSDDRNPEFILSIDGDGGSLCNELVSSNGRSSDWVWLRSTNDLSWSGGQARVQIAGTKEQVGLDCVVVTQSASFNPTGFEDCAGPGETEPAAITITAPLNTTTVSGQIDIEADVSNSVSVQNVTFYIDGAQVGDPDTSAPYSVSWDTTAFSNDGHSITAVVRDTQGGTQISTGVNVIVDNNVQDDTDPTVDITNPDQDIVNDGNFTFEVDASDNTSVERVELQQVGSGEIYDADLQAPFSVSFPPTLPNGDYVVQAVAYDAAGNSAVSDAVQIRLRLVDINRDGNVGVFDLSSLLGVWQTNNTEHDLNADGSVGLADLAVMLGRWGSSPSTVDYIPTVD